MPTKTPQSEKNTQKSAIVSEVESAFADTDLDERVFDDRMESFEDDLREAEASLQDEIDRQRATYIPPKMLESFAKKGFTLRWVRFLKQGRVDRENLQLKRRQKYEFVRPEEIKQYAKDMSTDSVDFTQGDVILAGDLVLMRTLSSDLNHRKKLKQRLTDEKEGAMNKALRDEGFVMKRKPTSQNLYRGAAFGSDKIEG